MRLIDADELYKAMFHGVAEIIPEDERSPESYKRGWNDALESVADKSCTPTIDAEPVKRESEWKWCHDCKEYDKENHCCHRWSTMIRDTLEEMQIIRCKDCINFTQGKDEWGSCFENPLKMWRDTDYCSWGERRTDA